MRDTVGLVMMAMGKKLESFTDADFDAAIAELQKAKDAGQIKGFTGNDYTKPLASGDTAACFAWTGDVVQLRADNPNLGYTLPQTGCTLWSDNFVIPALARHKKNAERLINYYYDPKVMAQVVDYVNYISVVKGTQEILKKLDPAVSENQLIFPSAETLSRAHVFRGLTAEEETLYNKKFQALVRADGRARERRPGAHRLTKTYDTFTAVDNVDLTIPQGSFFALLGPSGCGKTTTLRMVAGLEQPTVGTISIGGRTSPRRSPTSARSTRCSRATRCSRTWTSSRTSRSACAAACRTGEPRPWRHSSWSSWRTSPAASRPSSPGASSSASRWRGPSSTARVLLLDEPLGALDLKLRRQMQIELKRIQHEVGLTFVHVTHDQEEAMTMADTIAVMNAGRLEQVGDPATLYERPQTTFVANFLGQSNLLRASVTGMSGEVVALDVQGIPMAAPALGAGGTSELWVGVRPEKVRSSAKARTGRPTPCVVTDASFIGVSTQYLVHAVGPGADGRPAERRRATAPLGSRCAWAGRRHRFALDAAQDAHAGAAHEDGDMAVTAISGAPVTAPRPRRRARVPYLLLLPGMLWLAIFFALPMVFLASTSLQTGSSTRLHPHLALRDLRRRAADLLAAVRPVVRLRRRRHPPALALGYPLAYVHRAQVRQVEERPAGAGHRAVLHQLPDPHAGLADDPVRQGRAPVVRTRSSRSPGSSTCCARSVSPATTSCRLEVRGDLRPDVQLPAVHGAAAVRQPRTTGPPAAGGSR